MNNRSTYVGIVLFFAGLIGLWWADHAKIPDREARRLAEPRVLPALVRTRPDEVQRIEIDGGPERLAFERREGNRWQMTAPRNVAADPSMVETLAFNLKELAKAQGVGTLRDDPSAYGLKPPARVVRIFGEDTSRPIAGLEVGSVTHDARYVRVEGSNGIEVVAAKALAAVELPASRWRDRALLRFSTFQADALTAIGPGRDLRLEREGDLWRIRTPFQALANVERVEGVLAELSSLRVADGDTGFVADDVSPADLANYGLDAPRLSITVKPKSGEGPPRTIHLGKPAPKLAGGDRYYARRDEQDDVVVVDAHLIKDLGANPIDLHGKKVADIRPDRVDFLRFTSRGAVVTAARRGGGWVRLSPLNDRADGAAIQDLLKRLDGLEASLLLDDKSAADPGLNDPMAVLEVWQDAGQVDSGVPATPPRLSLTLGRVDAIKKTLYVRTAGDPVILAVPSTFAGGLTFGGLAFRDRQVAAAIPPTLDRVVVSTGGKSFTLVPPAQRGNPAAWRLETPVAGPADPEAVGRLLLLLSNLRADTLVTDRAESVAQYGLDKPVVTVAWTVRGEAQAAPLRATPGETITLAIGEAAPLKPGARYARVSTSPIVFTLPPEALAVLETEWRDRLVMELPVREIERVTLRWPALSLGARPIADVKTKDPEWTLIDPPAGIDFDAGRIKTLVTSLTRLQTFRYTQYDGPIDPKLGLFPARLAIEITLGDGKSRTLRLGTRSTDGYLHATTEDAPNGLVFLLPLGGWEPWVNSPRIGPGEPAKP